MKALIIVIACLAALLSGESFAKTDVPETKNPYIPLVAKLYDQLEFDTALSTLQKAANWPGNTPQDLRWIELMDGVLQGGAGKDANALEAFKRALLIDSNAQLPVKSSAKLRALLARARADLGLPPPTEAQSSAQTTRAAPPPVEPTPQPIPPSPTPAGPTAEAASQPPPSKPGDTPVIEGRTDLPPRSSSQSIGLLVGLRGEADILGRGLTSAATAEVGRGPFAGALTVLVQRAPGVRVEGRYYFLDQKIRPYAAVGATTFFPDTAARLGAGVVLALGSVHLSADAAYERIFNPSVSYAPNVLLFSLGAGWRFPLTGAK